MHKPLEINKCTWQKCHGMGNAMYPIAMKRTYKIRYNHTSPTSTASKREAIRQVRSQMRHMGWGRLGKPRYVDCEDGLYCYMSTAEANADTDGSRAFAVICGKGFRE